ncbi:MAG: hypothetical protein Q4G64_06825, partial [bacterium]|nr:hypothetical protein [bacterium]
PAPAPAPAPTPPPPPPAPAVDVLSKVRSHAAAAGCSGVGVVWGDSGARYAQADWYNYTIIVGGSVNTNRLQWIGAHECAHFQQVWEYGSPEAVINSLGWDGLECDADRRAARILGYSAGAYC